MRTDSRSEFHTIRDTRPLSEPLDSDAISAIRAELTKTISRSAHIATILLTRGNLREGALIAVQNLQLSLEQLNYFLDESNAEKTP